MVTAGIYLILRCSPLLIYSLNINILIIFLGSLTAIMSASIAIFQDDIKKIIAYSTCSQLGYMFFSCGLMNYEVAFFHLINHAFFKALLFLSAGSIIHSLSDEQDLKKMGGLVNLLPFTYSVFIVGSLAIMGFPYLTGFYSKDSLIELIIVNSNNNISFYCTFISLFTAILTNIYSLRIIYLVFLVKTKSKRILIQNIHDAPSFMLFSQFILSFFSIFIGFFFFDLFLGLGSDI
jgi:NADH:ubiquinone oxidoreductase subunit 5 (subunit L)/multisubunit Na+/H+ antiporter MnhA subunit